MKNEGSPGKTEPCPPMSPLTGQIVRTPLTDDLPTCVRKKRLDEFRQTLYHERVDRLGYLQPSEGSSPPDEKQERCKHPFLKLRWSANQHGHFAMLQRNHLCKDFYQSCWPLAIQDARPLCVDLIGINASRIFQNELRRRGLSWLQFRKLSCSSLVLVRPS